MTLFGARMASKGLWAGGDAVGWKLRLRASGGQVRGKFVAGGCMTTSSHGLGLFFENFFNFTVLIAKNKPAHKITFMDKKTSNHSIVQSINHEKMKENGICNK